MARSKKVAKRTVGPRYRWRPASRFTALDAQAIGTELERLRQENGTHVAAEDVVEAAKSMASPLHDVFTWDDQEAAYQHRLHTARTLLRSVQVVIITPEQKELEVMAFVSTPNARPNSRSYTTVDFAMRDPE